MWTRVYGVSDVRQKVRRLWAAERRMLPSAGVIGSDLHATHTVCVVPILSGGKKYKIFLLG